ncbi:type II toxin-antitoxin system VapC family toxin [Devosia aurantiaca]|uniref:Type II toxin-antitoxin system VapC family toxin n=1 Tax=Devosia aurantiaca TaxID=2714858 RepID=A0A6M1SLS3_9HYPH|nr:type II toxin-antitoxin system VapC family toxin [Devosia aurantiaca]NGP17496.1 type II toxin-antitoxin system VapC family toxin [Devosia aurantiaca]
MRLLLDTHVAVWSVALPSRLPQQIRRKIERAQGSTFVSAVSLWEISIKAGLGRNNAFPFNAETALMQFQLAGFAILDVTAAHAVSVGAVAIYHGDPFDRLILAQALSEPMSLVTHDAALSRYSDTVITW